MAGRAGQGRAERRGRRRAAKASPEGMHKDEDSRGEERRGEERRGEERRENGGKKASKRTSVARVAKAADVLHGVPGGRVHSVGLGRQVLFGPARAALVAVLGANGTLARHTVVAGVAGAGAGFPVALALVAALLPRVHVVGAQDGADPGKVLGADALRAIGASPLGLARQTSKALAVRVHLARAVVGAVVLTQTTHAMPLLVRHYLPPCLLGVGWRRCGHASRRTRRARGLARGLRARVARGLHCGLVRRGAGRLPSGLRRPGRRGRRRRGAEGRPKAGQQQKDRNLHRSGKIRTQRGHRDAS